VALECRCTCLKKQPSLSCPAVVLIAESYGLALYFSSEKHPKSSDVTSAAAGVDQRLYL